MLGNLGKPTHLLLSVLSAVLLMYEFVLLLLVEDALGRRGVLERVHGLFIAVCQLRYAGNHHRLGTATERILQEASEL